MRESKPQELFDNYVSLVRGGQPSYEKEAREVAAIWGFPIEALET